MQFIDVKTETLFSSYKLNDDVLNAEVIEWQIQIYSPSYLHISLDTSLMIFIDEYVKSRYSISFKIMGSTLRMQQIE